MNDQDGQTLKGHYILHSTLRRDFVCGECGSRLITKLHMNEESRRCEWRTVCAADPEHSPSGFIHTNQAARREAERLTESLRAREVFRHLPQELQEAILERA